VITDLLNFHFLRPLWLLLLPLLALAAWHLHTASATARWKHLIAPHLLPHLVVRGSPRSAGTHGLLALLAIACLALAGPTWNREVPPFVEHQAPLLIGLDLSRAMDARDIGPSRLERAKLKLRDLLQRRPGARHALLVYAGSAHVLLPPTDDPQLFLLYLDSLQTDLMPRPGKHTSGVLDAMDRLQSAASQPYMRLLVTDAVEAAAVERLNAGNTVVWAARADAEGLATALEVPVIGMQSNDSDLSRLNRALDASLRQARQNDTRLRWQDRGWWLLWPVALLLLLRMRSVAQMLLLLPLFTTPSAQADELELWRLWHTPDQHAMHLFAQGDYREAARLFSSPPWRGAALYRAGDYEAALSTFEQRSDARAYYNQGNALARLERYAEAAERFQLARAEVPHWQNAQDNYDLVLRLAKRAKEDGRSGEPGQVPDEIRFDLEKNRGKAASALQSREEQARLWLDTLETSPAGYLKRRMLLQLQRQETAP